MKLLRLLAGIFFLGHLTAHAQGAITAVATKAACVGDGTITITVTNVAGPITYAVAKLPYNEAAVITSTNPVITNLETGDYYYGYYSGTTFVKAAAAINVGSTYSTVSPTITSFFAVNYTYCGNDPDPLGKLVVNVSGGNPPYIISLLKASDESEVQRVTTSTAGYTFINVQPGTYKAKLMDNCGVTTTSISNVTLNANVTLKADDIGGRLGSLSSYVDVVYNTPGDICSGIKSAALSDGAGAVGYLNFISYITSPSLINVSNLSFVYKLEIQNGTGWDVYDNLTYTQLRGRFSLPADRSKWGLLRVTGTYCGISKTFTQDLGGSTIGKVLPFTGGIFNFSDDPASNICATTGKVSVQASGYNGCLPYTFEVTDNAANTKMIYTTVDKSRYVNFLLDIGKTYSFKLTDNTGTEVADYSFRNWTTNPTKPLPGIAGPNNVFIDPLYFSPAAIDLKSQISFYRRPSGINFNKSALAVIVPSSGFTGDLTASLINGPSPISFVALNASISGKKAYNLGENLTPGTYKIRIKDSGCFDEVFDVTVDCYFSKIEITSISAAPSTTICDRYVKTVKVSVSMVGTADSFGNPFIFSTYPISVQTVSGPVTGTGSKPASSFVYSDYLKDGSFDLVYQPEISGTYEIGLTKNTVSGFLPTSNLWEGTTTKTIKVEPNFPTFDLSQSGGIICTGNTTGNLYVKVDNTAGNATYFIKKDTDAAYPATGQTNPVFTGLTAGNYVVKAKTACYEVEQPLILRAPLSKVISGSTAYCDGGSVWLVVNQTGPVSSIKWTTPDGTVYNTADLKLDNLTPAQSGMYKVEVTSLGGCYFTESFNVNMNDPKTPTGASAQEFCKNSNAKVSDLKANEAGVMWYDAATGGTLVPATTPLINGKIYYGALQLGDCKSVARFAVTVTISDPQTPTTINTTQEFCKANNNTVADLKTTESGVTWYDDATGVNAIPSTTVLENNKVYYGSLKAGTCESPTRLAVTVTLSDPQTPTTAQTTQEFCKADHKTVADLQTAETGVTWYDAATAGTVVPSTTVFENNKIYYGSLKTGTCESPARLAVTVKVNDPKTPTGEENQQFCQGNNPKVSDLRTTESGVIWYDSNSNGNIIAPTTALENKIYWGVLKVGTCESQRLRVNVNISNPQTPTGSAGQEFCKVNNPKISDLVTKEGIFKQLNPLTGKMESVVRWYDAATGGNELTPDTALKNGTVYYGASRIYYGSLNNWLACDNPVRFAVTVTLSDPQTPTTVHTTQEFCKVDHKTVADLQTAETGVTWFDAEKEGNIVPPTTVLTNGTIYYGSLKIGTCESPTRLAVKVTLSDPQTPTTAHTTQEFCKVDNKTVADLVTNESDVTWYDAEKEGNVVPSTTVLENNKVYYGSLKVGTCESPTRLAVTVNLSDPKTPTTAQTTQEFCKTENKTVADLVTNESDVTWYDSADGTNVVPLTTVLENNKVYYGSLKAGNCESPTRLAVTVTLSDPQTPTTAQTTQEFCKVDNKTVADLVTTESGVTWYDSADGTTVVPLTTVLENNKVYYGSLKVGTCDSPTRLAVTVTLSDPQTPTTTHTTQEFCRVDNKTVADLVTNESDVTWYDAADGTTVVPLTTVLENNKVYYGSLKVGTCDSPTRLAVTVNLSDPKTPTTAYTTQEFCKADNKTVADLVTNESDVTWYDSADGITVVPSTTVLENNKMYYGSLKVGTCESPTRLAVTVILSDPQTPTTAHTTQEFCKVDNKTVADLVTNESDVTWYDSADGTTVVPLTTVLENNKVYYGSLKVGTCESPTRLAVTVNLSDPKTPTTSDAKQEFCKANNNTVADLKTNETGVTWYDSADGITVVPSTTVLENNKVYYGSLQVGTCESPTRLPVTVTLSDPKTPTTTHATQEFCKADNKTVADLVTTESGVTWYDSADGITVVPLTAVLENNKVYYGSLKVGTCESPTRLAVTVNLSDPQTPTTAQTTQEFCKADNKTVADLATTESDVTWYDSADGTTVVPSTTVLENNKVYYGSLKVGTCESPTRLAVTVNLSDPKTPTTTHATQEFCKVDNKTVADLATTESGVTWYDAEKEGNVVPPTTVLTDGTTYYGSLKVGTCDSPTRLAVTVTLSDPKTPMTTHTTQEFCKTENKTVADLSTTESGVTWYDAEKEGNVVPPTTVLTDGTIYYGSLQVGTCESPTRLAVTAILSDPKTPTTTHTTQEFCRVDNKTVSDLVTTESGVTWYDAEKEGNVVPPTTVLTDGTIYYGSLKVGTCESPTRLAVTVNLSDPKTPTTTHTTQEFCRVDNKTVSDLATTESGVTWYDAEKEGNVVPPTTVLTDGTIYYGSLKVGTCESPTRLAVTVNLSDPKTPTTTQTTQEFCRVDNKTVADLVTTESGVTWYDAEKEGNVVPPTTVLTDGTIYYGSIQVGTCESPTRLAVTVRLSDPKTPTTAQTTQEFCKVDNKTVADLVTNESDVTWYDAADGTTVVPSTTVLENNKVYYGSLKVGTCESPTRLVVTVNLSDPKTPTTAQTTQEFCRVDNKTVADLVTTESGVTWYDAEKEGNVVPPTTVLTDGTIYYGSLKTGTCDSPTRLAVTVNLSDPKTPTTTHATQEFCKVDNKTVADLATTESGVTWYDAEKEGNVVPPTTVLTDGTIYYGSLQVGTCESPTRLAVTVNLSDPKTPTTAHATQEFCRVDNKTVADLVTTESGVTWFDAEKEGNVVPSTTVLTDGTIYYGSLKVGTCESPTRLAVTVRLSDPQTPTTAHTTQEFCKVDNKTVADLVTNESDVTWYDAADGTTVVPLTTVLENNKMYYGSLKTGTCDSPIRLAVTVTLSDPKTPTTTHTTQEFCRVDNKTVADLVTTESGVTWYDSADGTTVVPLTTVLENNKVYYGSLQVGTCESPTRLAVTVTLSDPQTPTTAHATQEFCKVDNKTVADLVTNESDVTWYDSADGTTVVSSTTVLENNKVYYGSLKVGTCESPTRLAVTAILSDPKTPTTTHDTQEFCKVDNKTVADLVTNESDVTWYDAADGTTVVPSTTVLENNKVYYGSLKTGICDSPTRLAVTVTLSDPQTPTTAQTTQEFCRVDNKTVADLVTNESDVTWYDAADGTNVVPLTTVLENNKVYYGSLKAGNCESPTRLAVTVTLSDPQTPTTAHTTQEFCKVDNKTVADLVTNESDVTWYDAEKEGNVVPPTTVLTDGTIYYGSLQVGTCESPTRLAVTAILSDPKTPTTTHDTQEFCKVDNKTVADLVTNESDVTWYDAADGTTVVPSTTVLENNKVYYGSLKTGICDSPTRLAVTVTLSDPQTPTTAQTTQEFCRVDNKTVSDLVTTESGVTWYDAEKEGNVVPPTTVLTDGTIYYGSLKVGTCESPTRLAVTVTLSDPKTPTTTHTTQEFCKVDNKTVADLETTETGVTWYDAEKGGNVVAPTTVLTDGTTYYGSLKVGICDSPTRLAVKVILSDPQTPTGATTQEFCRVDNKTVADLVTTESGVTWYDSADGTTVVPLTAVLENNKVYYGSLKVGTCESPARLAVTVTLSDPKTPTTAHTTQEFCKADNNTVADLKTTEAGVTWYDSATGIKALASTALLENNKTYYGSLKVGACESPIRLAVQVVIKSNDATPAPDWSAKACVFDEITYKTVSGMSDYNWLITSEGDIIAGGQPTDDYVTVVWNSVGKAVIKVDYIDISKCDPIVSVNFPVTVDSCSDIGLKMMVDNATPGIGQQVVFTLTAENLGISNSKEVVIENMLPSGYQYVDSNVSKGNYDHTNRLWSMPLLKAGESQTLKVIVKVKGRGDYLNIAYLKASNPEDLNETNNRAQASVRTKDVVVYNALSTNEDGINDYFRIEGLDQYPNNTVEIFNAGGVQIFNTNNYGSNNNVFRGISEGRATINKKTGVPTGTYYYILRYEAEGTMMEKAGYLYVSN